MDLFKNTYRITGTRLKNWNYSAEGRYFITICTKNHFNYFGEIVKQDRKIGILCTEIGNVANDEWFKTINIRPDMNLELLDFSLMPNHLHGIIAINRNQYNTALGDQPNRFGPQHKNLSSLIRGYKASVTSYALKKEIPFQWQPRFHEHLIRSEYEYERISNYIQNNPIEWYYGNRKMKIEF